MANYLLEAYSPASIQNHSSESVAIHHSQPRGARITRASNIFNRSMGKNLQNPDDIIPALVIKQLDILRNIQNTVYIAHTCHTSPFNSACLWREKGKKSITNRR